MMKTSPLADVGFLVGVAVVSMASEDGSCRRAKGKEWSPRSGSGSPKPAGVFVADVQVCESSLSYIVMCLLLTGRQQELLALELSILSQTISHPPEMDERWSALIDSFELY